MHLWIPYDPILALLLYSPRHSLPNIRRRPYGKTEQRIGIVKLRQRVLTPVRTLHSAYQTSDRRIWRRSRDPTMRVFPALVTTDCTSHIGRTVIIHDKSH